MIKITPAQKAILEAMQKGRVLSRTISTKYVPFEGNPEHSGTLYDPHYTRYWKTILVSTIKAMEAKGLIVENNRYVCSTGSWGEHETEEWCIIYKLNLCIDCYEQLASAQFNGMFCEECAKKMGDQWEAEQAKHLEAIAQ